MVVSITQAELVILVVVVILSIPVGADPGAIEMPVALFVEGPARRVQLHCRQVLLFLLVEVPERLQHHQHQAFLLQGGALLHTCLLVLIV